MKGILLHNLLSPKVSYRWARYLQPWFGSACLLLFILGLTTGLWMAPADFQQGNVYRIMFVHVPAALASLAVYSVMAAASILYLIWKPKVADMIAECCVSIGIVMTLITLITGGIWGKPTWGTWWIWDARLTSELILLFIYFSVAAVRHALKGSSHAARITSTVTLMGWINIPIVHFSVDWWQTLHQGASLFIFKSATIAPVMLRPLIMMMLAYAFLIAWLLCQRLQNVLLIREDETRWVKDVLGELA